MKKLFFPRLAWNGIRNNRRLYLPYYISCTLMISIFYILSSLSKLDLSYMRGGSTLRVIMMLGSFVIAIFAAIFLFYVNSFLTRRRKREFGLYNILGMGKWNIGRILFWDAVITSGASLVSGLIIGVALSKFSELTLIRIMQAEVNYSFVFSGSSVLLTVVLFGAIFALVLLNSIRQIHFSNPADLVKSESFGEKPPKANWFLGIVGILILGAAYYLAVTIDDPISALVLFFVAVIMVIVATYLIMISGSVMLCKILQKNKKYYYNKRHFVSVSSMAFRMKRNGAGLASICILATMVLVMISSTSCLYFGEEEILAERFPYDISIRIDLLMDDAFADHSEAFQSAFNKIITDFNVSVKESLYYTSGVVSGALSEDGSVDITADDLDALQLENVKNFFFLPVEEYNRLTGSSITVGNNEAYYYKTGNDSSVDHLSISGVELELTGKIDDFDITTNYDANPYETYYLVISDMQNTLAPIVPLVDEYDTHLLQTSLHYDITPNTESDEELVEIFRSLSDALYDTASSIHLGSFSFGSCCIAEERADFYGTFGGLFFLGIMLSIVFIVAAVLIIYYKQLSEGFEDHARFSIMQKVGMTKQDIRHSINSQMLTVFLLPLVFSVMHLCFAFPMVRQMLTLFQLTNTMFLVFTAGASVLVYTICYVIIYRLTSNVYYSIVSGAKE